MARRSKVPNRISATLEPAKQESIQAALAALEGQLPFLVGLTSEEQRTMLRAGDASRAFIDKAAEVAPHVLDYLPRSFELAEMEKDVALLRALYPVYVRISALSQKIEDTLAIVTSEAYAAALTVYSASKEAKGAEGLEDVVDDLARRFARKSSGGGEPTGQ